MANPVSPHSAGHRRGVVCAPHYATAEAYKAFRGRLPTADALQRKRGFAAPTAAVN